MLWTRRGVCVMALVAALFGWSGVAAGQSQTGNITGRATDESGGALPGVTVTLSSPQMIGGSRARRSPTSRASTASRCCPTGTFTVSFQLPGFNTLNIEGVNLPTGVTATINGS